MNVYIKSLFVFILVNNITSFKINNFLTEEIPSIANTSNTTLSKITDNLSVSDIFDLFETSSEIPSIETTEYIPPFPFDLETESVTPSKLPFLIRKINSIINIDTNSTENSSDVSSQVTELFKKLDSNLSSSVISEFNSTENSSDVSSQVTELFKKLDSNLSSSMIGEFNSTEISSIVSRPYINLTEIPIGGLVNSTKNILSSTINIPIEFTNKTLAISNPFINLKIYLTSYILSTISCITVILSIVTVLFYRRKSNRKFCLPSQAEMQPLKSS